MDEKKSLSEVQKLIQNSPALIFSIPGCAFSKKAKDLLKITGAKYTEVEIDKEQNKEMCKELMELTSRTSFPSIFVGKKFIGGCNDGFPGIIPLHNKGELIPMLRKAGAL
ncbi:hypothetical protein AAMO2058_001018600 [Amorphochlora amoebiformis]